MVTTSAAATKQQPRRDQAGGDKRMSEVHKPKTTKEGRHKAFGSALAEAMEMRRITQLELGEKLGLTQSAVSSWRVADAVPDTEVVFAVERALKLPPGHLSRHLGYYPPAAVNKGATVEEAVLNDTVLDESGKRAVIAVWRELTTRAGARRGRPPRAR